MPGKSLLMIDVDGVLNPSTSSGNHSKHVFKINYSRYSVYLNPEHGKWLTDLAERTDSELVWCTMWEQYAPMYIAPVVGLPQMPFVPICKSGMSSSVGSNKAFSAVKYANGRKFVSLEDEPDFQKNITVDNGYQVLVDYVTGLQMSHIDEAENYLLGPDILAM